MSTRAKVFCFLILFLLSGRIIQAQKVENIIISEVAWMGTDLSPFDEWLELYNNSSQAVSLDGWQLLAQDGSPAISLRGIIDPGEYFLLERTDDTTLPTIKADLIYTGGLNNQGEHLMLLNKAGEIIDQANCADGWFFGSNEEKKTMERKIFSISDKAAWQTSTAAGGTPKAPNSQPAEETNVPSLFEESKDPISQKKSNKPEVISENQKRLGAYIPLMIGIVIALSSAGVALWLKQQETN